MFSKSCTTIVMSEIEKPKSDNKWAVHFEGSVLSMQYFDAIHKIHEQRTSFFDRLTLGCGATITALVSFVANQHAKLQPPGVLKNTILALLIAICLGLVRSLSSIGLVRELFIWLRTHESSFHVLTGVPVSEVLPDAVVPMRDEISNETRKSLIEQGKLQKQRYARGEIIITGLEAIMSFFVCRAAYELFRLVAWNF